MLIIPLNGTRAARNGAISDAGVLGLSSINVMTGLMHALAFEDEQRTLVGDGYVAPVDQEEELAKLFSSGFVIRSDAERWFSTQAGRRCAVEVAVCNDPKPMFSVNPLLALEDRSSYELLCLLGQQGWKWKPLVPASTRKKLKEPPPLEYWPGKAKNWMSTGCVIHHSYLLALADVEV